MEEEEEGRAGRKACAACKHVHGKCDHNCIFAPYFPQGREKQFHNAHKLFGFGNISKMIRVVQPHLKDHTMKTIMFESEVRALDPVGGSYALSQHLYSHIQNLSAELESTRQQLALYRGSSASSSQSQSQSQELPNVVDPNSEGIRFIDWEALQELIRDWPNHIPVSRQEEDEEKEDENDEKSAVLDLINKIK